MNNIYSQFPNVYGASQSDITPYWQNISSQNQSVQRLLQQGNQLANANLNSGDNFNFDGAKMANALRGIGQTINSYSPWTQNQIGNTYGTDPYSEQSRMLAMQERGM